VGLLGAKLRPISGQFDSISDIKLLCVALPDLIEHKWMLQHTTKLGGIQ
jgi:hypothetical protein